MEQRTKGKQPLTPVTIPPIDDYKGKGRKKAQLENILYDYFQDLLEEGHKYIKPSLVDREYENILVGVCRLNWYKPTGKQLSLSYTSIISILVNMPIIHNEGIQKLLGVNYRQANRYYRALSISFKFIKQHEINSI